MCRRNKDNLVFSHLTCCLLEKLSKNCFLFLFLSNNQFFFPDNSTGFSNPFCVLPSGVQLYSARNVYNLLAEADIVILDFVFYMSGEVGLRLMPPVASHQIMMLYFAGESTDHYPHVTSPVFMSYFNVTIGIPRGFFDYPAPMPYMPSPEGLLQSSSLQLAFMRKNGRWQSQNGDAYVAAMVSNCDNVRNFRNEYLLELSAFINVDFLGHCFHNRDIDPSVLNSYSSGDWRLVKRQIFQRYPIVLAFENANCYDMITEKVFDALIAGAIPVYLGAPNIDDFVPQNSFIDARYFADPAELAQYLRLLLSDVQEFERYHAWRNLHLEDLKWISDNQAGMDPCSVLQEKHQQQCAKQ
eukprot:GILI01019368.1.p1 GENE.GILI01019368.1~~GILI01019368.1.p1  ORF type:complete len:354 (-),score=14.00 GILI01019368.1:66-1127(-)